MGEAIVPAWTVWTVVVGLLVGCWLLIRADRRARAKMVADAEKAAEVAEAQLAAAKAQLALAKLENIEPGDSEAAVREHQVAVRAARRKLARLTSAHERLEREHGQRPVKARSHGRDVSYGRDGRGGIPYGW